MKCPNCDRQLTSVESSDVALDVCQGGCGGIWFDRDELFKFDEPGEARGCDFLSLADSRTDRIKRTGPKNCPRCQSEPLVRQFLDHKNSVEIEQCWECGGIWFDAGELQSLRDQYTTFEDRKKAANDYCENIIAQYEAGAKARSKEAIAEHYETHGNRFRSFVTELKEILGFRNDPLDV